jgi:hypothetical protein
MTNKKLKWTDKIHGIQPTLSRKDDTVLYGLSTGFGSSPVCKGSKSQYNDMYIFL